MTFTWSPDDDTWTEPGSDSKPPTFIFNLATIDALQCCDGAQSHSHRFVLEATNDASGRRRFESRVARVPETQRKCASRDAPDVSTLCGMFGSMRKILCHDSRGDYSPACSHISGIHRRVTPVGNVHEWLTSFNKCKSMCRPVPQSNALLDYGKECLFLFLAISIATFMFS